MREKIMLAILMIKGMGRKTARKFINDNDLSINIDELVAKIHLFAKNNKRVKPPTVAEFNEMLNISADILKKQEEQGIVVLTEENEYYPRKLLTIDDAPLILFAKGNLKLLNGKKSVAIIGTREITERGKKVAKRFGNVLAENDIVVVSGLAVGCDTYGHIGCLEGKGETIAVLPSAIDEIYPASNLELAESIVANNGLLLSEYYTGQSIRAGYFVDRDRIQAGLSDGVIVVETDVEGGTMHTVKYTLNYKRDLACFYDEKNYEGLPQMNGNRKLISEGKAKALVDKNDLEDYIEGISHKDKKQTFVVKEEQIKFF